MKKMFFAAIVALFAVTTVSAQTPGNWAVGPKIGVYTNTGADGAIFGIGASGRYSFTDNWRMESGIMAICKKFCSVDISADVQYLFNIAPDWHIYPQAGLSANDIGGMVVRHQSGRRRRLLGSPQLGPLGRLQVDDPDR